jgi:hypothetical protein
MIDGIYTFIDNDGVNTHIDAEGLRKWCAANKPEVFWIPLNYEIALQMMKDNVIAAERIVELSNRKDLDPIIMCKDGTFGDNGGPNCMMVDGHHRYYLACLSKMEAIPGYFLDVEQWKPFQLHGLPNITRDQLIAAPILRRKY